MKRLNAKQFALQMLPGILFCLCMALGTTANATEQELDDSQKLVEYMYHNSTITGINLNGNSVVIKESEENSNCINIYIDENRNGIVDENEELVEMTAIDSLPTTNISANVPIYGVKDMDLQVPLMITVESGKLHSLYGVYSGSIATAENSALKINVKGGVISYGLYGVYQGNVNTKLGNTAIDIDVIDDAIIKYYFMAVYGPNNGDDATINGDVDIDWHLANVPTMEDQIDNFKIISSSVRVNGDVNVDVDNVCVEWMDCFTNSVDIYGTLVLNIGENCKVEHNIVGFSYGYITGDATINLYNAYVDKDSLSDTCYGIQTSRVDGDVNIVIDGGKYSEIRAVDGTSTQYASVGGDVNVKIQNTECLILNNLLFAVVSNNVKLAVDDSKIAYGYFLSCARVVRETDIAINNSQFGQNAGSNITHMLNDSHYTGRVQVNINNTSFEGSSGLSPYNSYNPNNANVYFNMKNVEMKDSTFISCNDVENPIVETTIYVDAKVGETTTVEEPLADLSGYIRALLNSKECMGINVDSLPTGIEWENGKIYGTPVSSGEYNTQICVNSELDSDSFKVRFNIEKKDCEFDTAWTSDDKHHWYACTDKGCDEVKDKAEHTWDDGTVTKEATTTEKGVKTYTCTVCKANKTEELPMVSGNNENTPGDEDGDAPETGGEVESEPEVAAPSAKGTVLKDNDKKGDYTVTNANPTSPEVSYKVTSKTAKEIVIPKTVTVDGVEYKVTSIKSGTFKNHKNLKKVMIGANVKTISKNAFSGCKKLTTVKMGGNVTTIGANAFYNCTALKSITIPKSVKEIGTKAFYNCKKLTKITINTTKLKKSKVGKKAFTKAGSNNYKKLTVKVPKSKKKTYKTMLKSRGLSSKAKVK